MDPASVLNTLALHLAERLRGELDKLETLRAETISVATEIHKPPVPPFRLSLSIVFLEPPNPEGKPAADAVPWNNEPRH